MMQDKINEAGHDKRNIYKRREFDRKQYFWNPRARRLARWNLILQYLIYALFLFLVGETLWRGAFRLHEFTLKFGGYLLIFLDLLMLNYGLQSAAAGLIHNRVIRLYPSARHDYALWEYQRLRGRFVERDNQLLLLMAQLNLMRGKEELAADALREVNTGRLKADQMKLYDLLQGAAEELISDGAVPSEAETVREAVAGTAQGSRRKPLATLLFTIMQFHLIFYFAVWLLPGDGWHLRVYYQQIGGRLAVLFLVITGVWLIRLYSGWQEKRRSADTGKAVSAGVWVRRILLVLALLVCAGVWWLSQFLTFYTCTFTERILARDIRDWYTGAACDYLAVDTYDSYNNTRETEYYRAQDFILMEEWERAGDYDPEKVEDYDSQDEASGLQTEASGGGASEEAENGSSGKAENGTSRDAGASSGAESSESDSGENTGDFPSQLARAYPDLLRQYSLVYDYLKSSPAIPDEAWNGSIAYDMDAKGNPYAIVGRGFEEVNGNQVETTYCLLDNGEKTAEDGTTCEEIVLEKFYDRDSAETELLGFYLVNPDSGDVTDEHKTSW